MVCSRSGRRGGPAPLLHQAWCAECRRARKLDSMLAFALSCRRAEPAPLDPLYESLNALKLPLAYRPGMRLRALMAARRHWRSMAAAILTVIAGGFGYLHWIDIDPGIVVPAPALPSPNAWAYFRRAGEMVVDKEGIDEALVSGAGIVRSQTSRPAPMTGDALRSSSARSVSVPISGKRQNAVNRGNVSIRIGNNPVQASDAHHGVGAMDAEESGANPDITTAGRELLLAENANALKTLRQGFRYSYMAPPVRSFQATEPYFGSFRTLARLLRIEATVYAARGRWAEAAESGLDAVKLGVMIQQHSTITGKLVGIACESIGRSAIWPALYHLSVQQAEAVQKRLGGLSAERPSLSDTIREEKWLGIAGLEEAMRSPEWRSAAVRLGPAEGPVGDLLLDLYLLRYSKREVMSHFIEGMNLDISGASVPYCQLAEWRQINSDAVASDKIADYLMPAVVGVFLQEAANRTQNNLLSTALALQAYHGLHAEYPISITAAAFASTTGARLTGPSNAYVTEATMDPFAEYGEPLHYEKLRSSDPMHQPYLLYSIGPDGLDNGGMRLVRQPGNSSGRAAIVPESKGDIVAGVDTD